MSYSVIDALVWAARALGWSPSPGALEVGPYSVVAELAHHLLARAQSNETDGFAELFESVEAALTEPTADGRHLVIVGFLEDLQNVSLNSGMALDYWLTWLGPETQSSWAVLQRFWAGELTADEFNAFVAGARHASSD